MTERTLTNLPASVHQRLLDKSRALGRPFNELLQYYAIERFLYRLSKTPQAREFVLKGALMLSVWTKPFPRPTKDVDLLGRISNDVAAISSTIRNACVQEVEPDGMRFDPQSIQARRITEDAEYEGIRVRLQGNLGNARVTVQLDVGFGDVVVPAACAVEYPAILDFPAPRLKGYSRESAIAEKFHAMVRHGELNSRMKDFYDVWLLSRLFTFDGETLADAVGRTFKRRDAEVPAQPVAFGDPFARDATKQAQWTAFVRKSGLTHAPASFCEAAATVTAFLGPVAASVAAKERFLRAWRPPGRWR
jgi:predicted nucleotidyltransferase component of viral defense system